MMHWLSDAELIVNRSGHWVWVGGHDAAEICKYMCVVDINVVMPTALRLRLHSQSLRFAVGGGDGWCRLHNHRLDMNISFMPPAPAIPPSGFASSPVGMPC